MDALQPYFLLNRTAEVIVAVMAVVNATPRANAFPLVLALCRRSNGDAVFAKGESKQSLIETEFLQMHKLIKHRPAVY
jgi:hypothetical protein